MMDSHIGRTLSAAESDSIKQVRSMIQLCRWTLELFRDITILYIWWHQGIKGPLFSSHLKCIYYKCIDKTHLFAYDGENSLLFFFAIKLFFKKSFKKNTNVCFYVCIWGTCVHGGQKRTPHLLELELQRVVGTRGRHCKKISNLPSPRGLYTHTHWDISPDFYILFSKKIVISFLEIGRKISVLNSISFLKTYSQVNVFILAYRWFS